MPKKQVTDPITDQEIAFARLVLAGTMTDRRAAEAAGLNPDTAAYTKSKPRVRDYMLEHSEAVRHQRVEQDVDLSGRAVDLSRRAVDQQHRLNQVRERVLARLWEIAALDSERTRNSMSSQVKALSLIAAIDGLIPGRRAVSEPIQPAPAPVTVDIYTSAWLRKQRENADSPPAPAQQQAAAEPQSPPGSADALPSVSGPNADPPKSTDFATPFGPSPTASSVPRVPGADFVPDTRVPFSIKRNPWARRR